MNIECILHSYRKIPTFEICLFCHEVFLLVHYEFLKLDAFFLVLRNRFLIVQDFLLILYYFRVGFPGVADTFLMPGV